MVALDQGTVHRRWRQADYTVTRGEALGSRINMGQRCGRERGAVRPEEIVDVGLGGQPVLVKPTTRDCTEMGEPRGIIGSPLGWSEPQKVGS